MAMTPEEAAAAIRSATSRGYRNDLLAKGQARSLIWREGSLPSGAPAFSDLLTYDLLSYAYSLMTQGLRLLDQQSEFDAARLAFESAASALEAVTSRGRANSDTDFHRLVAGACYHLARYSARAFSMLHEGLSGANLSVPERALALLMLRDLSGLEVLITATRLDARSSDSGLVDRLESVERDDLAFAAVNPEGESTDMLFGIIDAALSDNFMAAVSIAMLAFERGEVRLLEDGIARLRTGLASAGELAIVPQWWCHRLAIHILGDLWSSSFHERLPTTSPDTSLSEWPEYRELFIATLLRRGRAEIDLWPSQLDAATRALDLARNMVVSLPTSAGKTRIAELCILACLASSRRVVFVTPLRALSAQTEVTLQRTFQPLGKTVSSLYGAIGVSETDEYFLRDSDIIVATPEKLDFALRNQPDLLNDVGLVVLDEGHMIGLNEREVRYEVQIQRLLRRSDAAGRRIVCLSAILPDGQQLEDFTAWLTGDQANGLVKKDWRPTRLRFGEVVWKGDHARLDILVGAETPWIENFVKATLPKGRKTRRFPADQRELCIASAWSLAAEGHSVMIFCPQRSSVEPFAKAIVELASRGTLTSVLAHEQSVLENALSIGAEWLGSRSAVLACLRLGVAIHHGALPTAFRKEIERLLRDGILRITVSSPTLAQGLNLSATTVIFHGLNRHGEVIDVSEFRNVIGRAGRAYVDVEGLVLMPMYDRVKDRRDSWRSMIENAKGKEMESGLLRLVLSLMRRMQQKHRFRSLEDFVDYLAGNSAWAFPVLATEGDKQASAEKDRWDDFVSSLDTAILSMLGENEVLDPDIETTLDQVLTSSLWTRRLRHRPVDLRQTLLAGLSARARHIWSRTTVAQRRGYFLAGVGLSTGEQLDAAATVLNQLLVSANGAILAEDADAAVEAIISFAEVAFKIKPFQPEVLPAEWRSVVGSWLRGEMIADLATNSEDDVLRFVEQALMYRLPWAMEAVRVRAVANHDSLDTGLLVEDLELAVAVAAVETGTMNRSAATLIRAGFSSRIAAIQAVTRTGGTFTTMSGLRDWLNEEVVSSGTEDPNWPTASSHGLWLQFLASIAPATRRPWKKRQSRLSIRWDSAHLSPGTPVRLFDSGNDTLVLAPDSSRVGRVTTTLNSHRLGLIRAAVGSRPEELDVEYIGPGDLTSPHRSN
jgi:superfamily II DNA/RNA helicase